MADQTEIKKLLKEAVKEVLQEERDQAASSHQLTTNEMLGPKAKAKGYPKAKSKNYVQFDESRVMTPAWGSDPRQQEAQWPCFAKHEIVVNNNRWGKRAECVICGLRVSYTPAIGAPANSTKFDHGPNVGEALERLRAQGWQKDELQPNTVKNMIKIVGSEKVTAKKSASSSLNKASKTRKAGKDAQEIPINSSADEEDFQKVNAQSPPPE